MCNSPYVEPIHDEREVLTVTPGHEGAKDKSMRYEEESDCDPLQAEIIAIDDESVSEQRDEVVVESQKSEVIFIDEEDHEKCTIVSPCNDLRGKKKVKPLPFLSFSVSENSGRVSVHYAEEGDSANVNFSVEDVVSKQSAERLLETKVKRSSKRGSDSPLMTNIDFDQHALGQGKLWKVS
jgi:hypothetical protein